MRGEKEKAKLNKSLQHTKWYVVILKAVISRVAIFDLQQYINVNRA